MEKKLNVKLDEKVAEGVYSNLFMIASSPSEFVLDFGRVTPGVPNAKIYSRVLMTPQSAKQLLQMLQTNIDNHEKQHGEIKIPNKTDDKKIGFQSDGQIS
ncbi:MAG: hypothetical protein CSB55_02405 [Candidatus Cloacimonadota bacterium]|nr:MAG: hypothetical protein CSB55_02405 [Candidatus Cloacimonadota bacterium]